MIRFLKDPLVHFLVIGAALFAISAWRGESIRTGREQIVVTAEQVAQVRDAASLLQGGVRSATTRSRRSSSRRFATRCCIAKRSRSGST